MTITSEQAFSLLQISLAEAQTSVRAYDTKAQIVGVGYIFALGIIGTVGRVFEQSNEVNLLTVLVPWVFVILPILFFGFVLYPTRASTKNLSDRAELKSKHIFFIDTSKRSSLKALKEAVHECDPLDEIAYELLKVSSLRDVKRVRFLRAMFSALGAFVLLFVAHLGLFLLHLSG